MTPARSTPRGAGRGASRAPVLAALDLGTNNCRMLIAQPASKGFHVIDSFSRTVKLGEGLSRTGELSEAAIGRAVAAVKICAQKMIRAGVTRTRAIATAAARAARNGQELVERLKRETGIVFDIISAKDEAQLAVTSCLPLLDRRFAAALVMDIGGGSTELIWLDLEHFETPRLAAIVSVPVGVMSLAEKHAGAEPGPVGFARMMEETREALRTSGAPSFAALGLNGERIQLLGTSGTVTTLAGVHLGLERYDRKRVDGMWMELPAARDVVARIAAMGREMRIAQGCVGEDRADYIVPGCAIFSAIDSLWPCAALRVADRGLREGLLIGLMAEARSRRRKRRRFRRRR